MNRPTLEQKEVVNSIDIPNFMNNPTDVELDQMSMAILNNVPGAPNNALEEKKHLDELDNYSKNFSREEWERVLDNAPFELMFEVLRVKMSVLIEYRSAMKDADLIMKKKNM